MAPDDNWSIGGVLGLATRATLRTLQAILAVVVLILYGIDLRDTTEHGDLDRSAWIYALIVAVLSILTCIIHCLVTVKRVAWCTWDLILFVLWIALFGSFASSLFGHSNSEVMPATRSPTMMRVAVWVDLINALLWSMTGVLCLVWCCTARRFTRRTEVIDPEALGQQPRSSVDFGQADTWIDKLSRRASSEADEGADEKVEVDALSTTSSRTLVLKPNF